MFTVHHLVKDTSQPHQKKATVEEISWTNARVSMICEARSIWQLARLTLGD